MNRCRPVLLAGILIPILAACSPNPPQNIQGLQTIDNITPIVTLPPQSAVAIPTKSPLPPQVTDTPRIQINLAENFPLSQPGPYQVGYTTVTYKDSNRADREVKVKFWYPVESSGTRTTLTPVENAIPDHSGKPYPLLLSSTKVANIFAPYLVSQGFSWASVSKIDYYYFMNEEMIDQPLDILFALNQAADNPPDHLQGMFDSDHAGAMGYSFDGYNSLAMSGARIDSVYYLAQCPTPDKITQSVLSNLSAYGCKPAQDWEEFSTHAGNEITVGEDGLWQPLTDPRILAVLPMACEGWWLFGDRGLAYTDRPVLMIVATNDELYKENILIFNHIGSTSKTFISFIGPDHLMIYGQDMVARMAHYATAFFGYHLKGNQEMAQYFSEEFVSKQKDQLWGVQQDE